MIQLFTDHYFHIGKSHLTGGKPCQDYAISQVSNLAGFAIVCDGCSSGRHTDIGSRILALATLNALKEYWQVNQPFNIGNALPAIRLNQKIRMAAARDLLGLTQKDMLATCLYALLSDQGGLINIQGDGVIALKFSNQSIQMSRFEWQNNMPYYPAYENGQLQAFINSHGNDLQDSCITSDTWLYNDQEFDLLCTEKISLCDGIKGITIEIPADLIIDDLEYIAIFSDGVTQIDGVDWKDAVVEFLKFKNTKGEFAKRRMIRGIKNMQKQTKGPLDDIAFAIIRIEQIEEEKNAK